MSLRTYLDVTSTSHRFHFELTSIPLRFHFDFNSTSLRYHFGLTSISHRFHFEFTSISFRFHFDFNSTSLRCLFRFTSISLWLHFEFTSIVLRSHFDFTWVKWKTHCHTREKGKLGGAKGKREKTPVSFELEFHLATRPRARTNETKRFPGRSHPPTSDVLSFSVEMICCDQLLRLYVITCRNHLLRLSVELVWCDQLLRLSVATSCWDYLLRSAVEIMC